MKPKRRPAIGPEFDSHQMNTAEIATAYAETLEYYRPRGFSKLARELYVLANRMLRGDADARDESLYVIQDAESLLSDWARRVAGHDYIAFGPFEHSGDVGFYYYVDGVFEDADLTLDAGDPVPRGFSGLVAEITDHGNVTVSRYSRGRRRELFSVV